MKGMRRRAARWALAGIMGLWAAGFSAARPHDPNLAQLAEYNDILAENPNDVKALRDRGSTFRALELYDDALRDLARADELAPDHGETLCEIGICRYVLAEPDKARAALERAEPLLRAEKAAGELSAEDFGRIMRELGETLIKIYRSQAEHRKALAQWERTAAAGGTDPAFGGDRADILLDLGRVNEALAAYEEVLAWNKMLERFCVGAANCRLLKGEPARAIAIFEEWSAADAAMPLPHMFRSLILRDFMHDEAGAAAAGARALDLANAAVDASDLPDFGAIVTKARVLQALRRHEEAAQAIERILEYCRGHHLVVQLLAKSYRALGRLEEADSMDREAGLYRRLNPKDWLVAYDLVPPERAGQALRAREKEESGSGPAGGAAEERGRGVRFPVAGIAAVGALVLVAAAALVLKRRRRGVV